MIQAVLLALLCAQARGNDVAAQLKALAARAQATKRPVAWTPRRAYSTDTTEADDTVCEMYISNTDCFNYNSSDSFLYYSCDTCANDLYIAKMANFESDTDTTDGLCGQDNMAKCLSCPSGSTWMSPSDWYISFINCVGYCINNDYLSVAAGHGFLNATASNCVA
jgi:hypothetical protein